VVKVICTDFAPLILILLFLAISGCRKGFLVNAEMLLYGYVNRQNSRVKEGLTEDPRRNPLARRLSRTYRVIIEMRQR